MAKETRLRPCVLCTFEYEGFGHNPAPLSLEGRCCDVCNDIFVIPERIRIMRDQQTRGA